MRSDLVAQEFIQFGLENLQGWSQHNLCGQPAALEATETFPGMTSPWRVPTALPQQQVGNKVSPLYEGNLS